ncbi:hypothetical protein V6N11_048135 [Hibiscus sabdariffa]|uniref:Uncharacterized protein n=1 Tax=Hibiscus sabdariffa TaxID=183260 RepID=A0ABR1ZCS6_9ROSI
MGLSIILERPSESITAKDERLAKRLKNHGDREVENLDQVDVEEIEADGVDGEVGKMDSKVQDGTDQQGHRYSYVSVVVRDLVGHGKSHEEPCLSLNDVVVLDEDCIVTDSGDFLTIKLSNCVNDQIDHCVRNMIIIRLLGRNIGLGAVPSPLPKSICLMLLYGLDYLNSLIGINACTASVKGVCASPPRAKDNSDQDQPKLSAGRSLSLYGPWIVASSKRRWFAPSASK